MGVLPRRRSSLARSVQRSAAKLREAAERVGAGDHAYRVSLEDGDELGEVALAFNAMVEKLAATEEMLRRAGKQDALGQLAGGIAHDFNNLLVVMLNNTHFVEEALPEGDPAHEDLREIRRAAERASGLTRQLLTFSRPPPVGREVLDLNAVAREMQPLLARSLGEDIEIEVRLYPGLPRIKGDPTQLEQIVLNLALNARDAMPEGGKLTIATDASERGTAVDAKGAPEGRVCLSVGDTGSGMTSEVAARAPEPLFSTKPLGEGTGLGLATVDRIVRGMHGRLDLASEPGRGTTVTVELPSTSEKPAAPVAIGCEPIRPNEETILLVEDEEAVRLLVRRILVRAGYTVLEAGQPSEALRLFAEHGWRVDLVLSDVVMPGMSGPAMFERMKHEQPQLGVLFISGYPDSVMAVHRTRENGFALLEKPFDAESLELRVREVLESHVSSS